MGRKAWNPPEATIALYKAAIAKEGGNRTQAYKWIPQPKPGLSFFKVQCNRLFGPSEKNNKKKISLIEKANERSDNSHKRIMEDRSDREGINEAIARVRNTENIRNCDKAIRLIWVSLNDKGISDSQKVGEVKGILTMLGVK